MRALSTREREVYEYITYSIRERGYSPSVREIRDALGFKSTSTVHMYIERLVSLGLITKDSGKSRTISLEQAESDDRVPIIGNVTAGKPIFAQEDLEGFIRFSASSVNCRAGNLYALRVNGDSMVDAGILDGDVVIVDKRNYAENGEIVVALIGDEATVKTFFKENGGYRLQPENEKYAPIIVDSVEILGKVVASVRFYK